MLERCFLGFFFLVFFCFFFFFLGGGGGVVVFFVVVFWGGVVVVVVVFCLFVFLFIYLINSQWHFNPIIFYFTLNNTSYGFFFTIRFLRVVPARG